jgi:hypothetical protein
MGVIELDRHVIGELMPVIVRPAKAPHEVGQRTGD